MFLLRLIVLLLGLSCHESVGGSKLILPPSIDEYDCINIYNQPAFENNLLQNHKIQMRPSFLSKSKRNNESLYNKESKFDSKGCPAGDVPIMRNKVKDHNIDINRLAKIRLGSIGHAQSDSSGHRFAGYLKWQNFNGAKAVLNLHNPKVESNQFSAAQIWVEAGPHGETNSLQAGWHVNPFIYGDNRTRLTAYWTRDFRKTGCFNLICKGFVQVHPKVYLGQPYSRVSIPGGQQYDIRPMIRLERETGYWWLLLEEETVIGYWPKELFTHLNRGGERFFFAGWVYSRPNVKSPPMGTGRFPLATLNATSYFAKIAVVDKDGQWVDVSVASMNKYVSNTDCYETMDYGEKGDLRQTFSYGGPGGIYG